MGDQSCAVGAAGREERPVLEELDVLHHTSPGPAPAKGPGTVAQLDAPWAGCPVHWYAAVFTIVTGFELPAAHWLIVGKGTYDGAMFLVACLRRDRACLPFLCS